MRRLSCALAIALTTAAIVFVQQGTRVAASPTLTGFETRITSDLADQWDPAISGNTIVYADLRGADIDIYYYDVPTGTEHVVTTAPGDQQLQDVAGARIAFSDSADVHMFDIANQTSTNLTEDAPAAAFDPAIGDSVLAWVDTRDGNSEIYARDLGTGEVRRLTNTAAREDMPAVSGRVVAWKSCTDYCDVYAYDWTTGTTRQVTATPTVSENRLAVSDDKIVFDAGVADDSDIYLFDLTDGGTRRLALSGAQVNAKIAGDYVTFEDLDANHLFHVKLWSLKTDEIFDLTALPGGPPATASQFLNDIDGNRIVYTDDRNGQLDIYMYEFTIAGDTTPPAIALTGCPTAPALLGSTHYVDVAVTDAESGVATQSPADGSYALQTATVGPHTFTADATDNAGNIAPQAVCAYTVVYDFEGAGGFASPIADPPAVNSAKAGSAVPVKFKLPDGKGGFISDLGAVASITVGQVGSFDTPPASEIEEWTTGESGLKYDAAAQQFIYIWKTEKSMAGQSFVLTLRLADGSAHTANFRLR